ncbi:MAG TPA: hypothetical protein VMU57_10675 [Edaphobacter sp.]|uniref:hypothetical protein n=1 Tax=Edaphobacter sp. TaxID=1934404 RepID=UPI002D172D13|nr:hypothetical protein [Edaphobacter sp.]HUZ95367.1 hypothetical protein [Edaphobacter sp.]
MRILFWRVERLSTHSDQTRVRIDIERHPQAYFYKWIVADPKSRRLNKRELHELDMRVAKYVATLNDNAPQQREHRTVCATL